MRSLYNVHELEAAIADEKAAVSQELRRLQGAVHQRLTSPEAFFFAFCGGFLLAWRRRPKVVALEQEAEHSRGKRAMKVARRLLPFVIARM